MSFTISKFYCTKCGREGIPIPRKTARKREEGHLKNLYCIYCKEETNHIEIRQDEANYSYEQFMEDFHNGRFVGYEKYVKE